MSFHILKEEVLNNIKEALECFRLKDTDEAEDLAEDIEFWLSPDLVLYDSSVDEEEIDAAVYDSIDSTDEYINLFLSDEIIKTYLSTSDLAVIVSSVAVDGTPEMCVGAIDRSTGVGMVNTENLLDVESLDTYAEIALSNSQNLDQQVPIIRKYQLVRDRNSPLPQNRLDNSQRRLTSLLSEIDQHVLSRYMGKEVQTRYEG